METNIRNAALLLSGLIIGLFLLFIFYSVQYTRLGLDFSVINFNLLHQEINMLWVVDFSPLLLSFTTFIMFVNLKSKEDCLNEEINFSKDFDKAFNEINARNITFYRNNEVESKDSANLIYSFNERVKMDREVRNMMLKGAWNQLNINLNLSELYFWEVFYSSTFLISKFIFSLYFLKNWYRLFWEIPLINVDFDIKLSSQASVWLINFWLLVISLLKVCTLR